MSNDIITAAYDFAIAEKSPHPELFEIAYPKVGELLEQHDCDEVVAKVGMSLMDIRVRKAITEGRVQDHIPMAVEVANDFFKKFDLSDEQKGKIINCIEAHHGDIPTTCIEAEICINADAYKFLHPRGFFSFMTILGREGVSFEKALDMEEEKIDEKYRLLSLDICRKELEPYYQTFKQYIADARTDK